MTAAASRWLRENEAETASVRAADNEAVALFKLAEQLGHVGHWRVNLPELSIAWSDAVYHIHGVTPECYTPEFETAIAFYHPDDRDTVRLALSNSARDGMPFEFSLRLIRAAGALRYVKCRGLTIPGPDGRPAVIFGVFIDVTEDQEATRKLEQFAYLDVLTHLANRRQFDETLEREWRRAIRDETALSLIMLDVDRFKRFNDLYGHAAGDECLHAIAGALASVIRRSSDLPARYGGEEFALIMPGTDAAGAETVALAVREAVAALAIAHAGNVSCGGWVTVSVGVATAYPRANGQSHAWLALITAADALLYEAKRTGRDRVISPPRSGPPLPAEFM